MVTSRDINSKTNPVSPILKGTEHCIITQYVFFTVVPHDNNIISAKLQIEKERQIGKGDRERERRKGSTEEGSRWQQHGARAD